MPWVTNDLNSPWYPVDEPPHQRLVKAFPEQHACIPKKLHDQLKAAWANLRKLSVMVETQRS
jgi:hypothetical protein